MTDYVSRYYIPESNDETTFETPLPSNQGIVEAKGSQMKPPTPTAPSDTAILTQSEEDSHKQMNGTEEGYRPARNKEVMEQDLPAQSEIPKPSMVPLDKYGNPVSPRRRTKKSPVNRYRLQEPPMLPSELAELRAKEALAKDIKAHVNLWWPATEKKDLILKSKERIETQAMYMRRAKRIRQKIEYFADEGSMIIVRNSKGEEFEMPWDSVKGCDSIYTQRRRIVKR